MAHAMELLDDAEKATIKAHHLSKVGMENRHWTAFFFGPYFKTIPVKKQYAPKDHKKLAKAILSNDALVGHGEDYLGALKRIILNRLDTDDTYGVTNNELVPLPFDAPLAWEYLVDFLTGTYLVAQATVVMFIAILIDNDDRGLQLGSSYTKSYLPLIKALVILYPCITLVVMTLLTCEVLFRKFMYYRLLSLRILVDWENKLIWHGWFFWYFIATWILLNLWCLYGVVKFWNTGVRSGADTVSFTTWIVVNLQTIQLLLYYYRLMTTETRLVSLNMIFERAPVEAQMLLTYTYVIEEHVLMEECQSFGAHCVAALQERVLHLLSCGMTYKDWAQEATTARFELDNLKGAADNFEEVEDMILKLRTEMNAAAEAAGEGDDSPRAQIPSAAQEPSVPPALPSVLNDAPATSIPSFYPTISPMGVEPTITITAGGSTLPVQPPPSAASAQAYAATAATYGAAPAQPKMSADGRPSNASERPSRRRRKEFSGNWAARLERNIQLWLYRKFYGTIHGFYCAVLPGFPSWPFRGDIPYLRLLLVFELLGILSVAAIVVFGVLRATSTDRCDSLNSQCSSCYQANLNFNATCPATYTIEKA